MIEIRAVEVEETYPIRKEELRKNVSLSHEMGGDHDAETLHLGLYEDESLKCIGSFMAADHGAFEGKQYQLRGMATTGSDKGKGHGRSLLLEAEKMLREKGVVLIWCNARKGAIEFYQKLGYKTWGETFEVDEIGTHVVMFKKTDPDQK